MSSDSRNFKPEWCDINLGDVVLVLNCTEKLYTKEIVISYAFPMFYTLSPKGPEIRDIYEEGFEFKVNYEDR